MSDINLEGKSGPESTKEMGGGEPLNYSRNESHTREAVEAYYKNFRKEQQEVDDKAIEKVKDSQDIKNENNALGKEVISACLEFDDKLKPEKTQDYINEIHGIERNGKEDNEKVKSESVVGESDQSLVGQIPDGDAVAGGEEIIDGQKTDEETGMKAISEKNTEEGIINPSETEVVSETSSEGEGGDESVEYEVPEELTEEQVREGIKTVEQFEEILFGGEAQTEEENALAETYKNADEKEREKMIAEFRRKYALDLGIQEGCTAETLAKEQKAIEDRLGDPALAGGLLANEKSFLEIIEKEENILAGGNPEEIKTYLEGMASNIDDCAARLKYVYLQMEMNPETKKVLQQEYIVLTQAIKKFEEAAANLRELIARIDDAIAKGENFTEADKKEISNFFKNFGKVLALLGAVAAIVYGIAKYSVAHPVTTAAVGTTSAVAVKIASIGVGTGGALITTKLLCELALLKVLLFDEERRDKAVEKIFGISLPAWAKKPPKKAKSEDKPGGGGGK